MALQALAINRHKHDLAAGGTGEQPAAEVIQMTFDEIEGTAQVKKRHQAPDGAKNELTAVVTYDDRMTAAAGQAGLVVDAPR